MECATRNHLVLSYLRCQAEQAELEQSVPGGEGLDGRRQAIDTARHQVMASRQALVEHCTQHGC